MSSLSHDRNVIMAVLCLLIKTKGLPAAYGHDSMRRGDKETILIHVGVAAGLPAPIGAAACVHSDRHHSTPASEYKT